MKEGPRYDFPAISDEGVDAQQSLVQAQPGDRVLRDEVLYEALDGWDKGEVIGTVHLEQRPTTHEGRTLFSAVFVFDDGDIVRYEGIVPGNGSWQGRGRAAFTGGTGKFDERRNQLPFESRNPKRWG